MEDLISFGTSSSQGTADVPRYPMDLASSAVTDVRASSAGESLLHLINTSPSTVLEANSEVDNLIDLADDTTPEAKHHANLEEIIQRPRQLAILPPPPIIEQWTEEKKHRALTRQADVLMPRGRAYLFVSHDKDLEKGVIEAVLVEMEVFVKGRNDILFQMMGPSDRPFLYLEAPSQDLVVECLDEARTCADNIINDKTTKLDLIFLEPPTTQHGSFEIMRLAGRPEMVPLIGRPESSELTISYSAFEKSFVQQLTSSLKKAGRIKDRINLRVHFGRYLLTSVPRPSGLDQDVEQRFGFAAFSKIIRHGRARGEFRLHTGDLREALQVLHRIKSNDKVFLAGDMATSTVNVQPEFYLDAQSSKWRLEANLRRKGEVMAAHQQQRSALEVTRVRAVEVIQGCEGGQLDFKTLSLGQTFDWKIGTVPDPVVQTAGYHTMESEIRTARINFPVDTDKARDEDYPRLLFSKNGKKAKELPRVAIKSVFRFRYSPAPYQVEFTIRREWPSAAAMSNMKNEPVTTFGVTVYGDHWGETRASDVTKTGQGWGQELEVLFRPIVDDSANNGEQRVQAMLNVIHDIRHALSG